MRRLAVVVYRASSLIPAFLLAASLFLPFLPKDTARDATTWLFVALLFLMAAIDLMTMRVPNLIVYPSIVFALVAAAVIDATILIEALAGGGATLATMLVIAVIGRGAMGMGDVKLACFSGCVLGLQVGFYSLTVGLIAGATISLPLMIAGRLNSKDPIPMVPFLAGGALFCAWVFGFLVSK